MSTRTTSGGTRLPGAGGGGGGTWGSITGTLSSQTDLATALNDLTFDISTKQDLDGTLTALSANTVITGHVGLTPTLLLALVDQTRNLVDDTSDQNIFDSAADALTVVAGVKYYFRAGYYLTKGTNSVNARPLFVGTATFTTFSFDSNAFIVLNPNVNTTDGSTRQEDSTPIAPLNVVASNAAANQTIKLEGFFEVNAGGTLIPQINWSGATGATPTVLFDTFFMAIPVGANPVTFIGPWS